MRNGRKQGHERDVVGLSQKPIRATVAIQIVNLDGVEAVGLALGNPSADDGGKLRALGVGTGVKEHLAPVNVYDGIA